MESLSASLADVLTLSVLDVEEMIKAVILQVRVGALETILSSKTCKYSRICEQEFQLASRNLESDLAGAELDSSEFLCRFAED